MNGPPLIAPLPRDQRSIDANQLNLLSIFHFVGAGLALLGLLFLIGHFAFMHFIFANPAFWKDQKDAPPPQLFAVFAVFYVIFGAWFILSGSLNIMSGLFIHERKNRTFSFVVAGLNCLHMPLGTILGVFTIIVLMRESVRQMYAAPV